MAGLRPATKPFNKKINNNLFYIILKLVGYYSIYFIQLFENDDIQHIL